MKEPRIKRTKELITSGGDVYVLRPTEDSDLRIELPDASVRALLEALDGTRTAEQLEREFGAERVGDALGVLADSELLDDAADDESAASRWTPPASRRASRSSRSVTRRRSGASGRCTPRARPAAPSARRRPTASATRCTTKLVEQRRAKPSPAATLGPVCAFVGGQVALEVVHRLTGLMRPATLGRSYVYDLRTMTVTHEDVPVVAGCPVCGGAAAN